MRGAMARAFRRESDFSIGNLNLKFDRAQGMSYTYGYYLDTLVFMIPPGRELSSFRKMIQPFDDYVWICLLVTFVVAVLVIIVIQFQSRVVKNFVYGTGVHSPCMNILTAVVGGSQERLPRRNFGRSLLMIFLLFCIVMRSVYQGSLYQFLQLNDLEPDPATVEEIGQRNMTYHVLVSWDELTANNSAFHGRRNMIEAALSPKCCTGTSCGRCRDCKCSKSVK
jgi:hypothetical protein